MRLNRFARTAALALAAVTAAAGSLAAAGPATATQAGPGAARPAYDYGPWTVENSPGNWENFPDTYSAGAGLGNTTSVYLECYFYGQAEGPYGNTLWYLAMTENGAQSGWINDHYLSTPGTAAAPEPQVPHCAHTAGTGLLQNSGKTFDVTGSPGNWGNSPTAGNDVSGYGITNGDPVELLCYLEGAETGPYDNTLWYFALDTTTGHQSFGWINDHYLNTPDTAANQILEASACVE
jgi:hypothetical protein